MKRSSLILAFLSVIGWTSTVNAQNEWLFYESFDQVSVNAYGAGDVPETFTLYNDQNTPTKDLAYFDAAWKVIRGADGQGYVSAPSLFSTGTQADRWLITPAVTLPQGSKDMLYFRVRAEDSRVRDGFIIKLSTTSDEKDAFTETLRTIRQAPGEWTDYFLDLSAFAGQTIRIAFIQNSSDCYMVSFDDIRIGTQSDALRVACNNAFLPFYMIPGRTQPYPVTATLQNWSGAPVTSARLCIRFNGKTETQTFSDIDIPALGRHSFSLDLKLEEADFDESDAEATFEIWFDSINGTETASDITNRPCYIADGGQLSHKTALLEIFSSAMCSGCGPWNKEFHGWDSLYGGNVAGSDTGFVIAKYQVNIPVAGDPLVTTESTARSKFYNIPSAPSWFLNGKPFELEGGTRERIDSTRMRLGDSIKAFRHAPSPFKLAVRLQHDGTAFTVDTRITGDLPYMGQYTLYVSLEEDSIHQNRAQMSGERDFYNVVRKMLPGSNGSAVPFLKIGETHEAQFKHTFSGSEPLLYGSPERVGVVAYLQNNNTHEILQAAFASADGEWSKSGTWINDTAWRPAPDTTTTFNETSAREAVNEARLYPNPAGETVTLSFIPIDGNTLTVSILNLQGRVLSRQTVAGGTEIQTLELPVTGLQPGLYFVRITNAYGKSTVKLLKK